MNNIEKLKSLVNKIEAKEKSGYNPDSIWTEKRNFLFDLKSFPVLDWKDYLYLSIIPLILSFGFFFLRFPNVEISNDMKIVFQMLGGISCISLIFCLFMSIFEAKRSTFYPTAQRRELIKKLEKEIKKLEDTFYEKYLSEEICKVLSRGLYKLLKEEGAPKDMLRHLEDYAHKNLERFILRDPTSRISKYDTSKPQI